MSQKDDIFSNSVTLLIKEAGLAATCLEQGLTSLRKADFIHKWHYYQSFFLLTIGLERIMKLTIITLSRIENNHLPSNRELKKYGHKIDDLFKTLMTRIDPDSKFLEDDVVNSKILKFLTEFASSSRYYNLDSLSGLNRNDDPIHRWKDIVNIIEQRHCKQKELNKQEQELVTTLNQKNFIIHRDEYDNPITDAFDFYKQGLNADKIQGYSVFYMHRIIKTCVRLLELAEKDKFMLPRFSEFFVLFDPINGPTNSQIKRRKNWLLHRWSFLCKI